MTLLRNPKSLGVILLLVLPEAPCSISVCHQHFQGHWVCRVIGPNWQGILYHSLDLSESVYNGYHSKLTQNVTQSIMPK